MSEANTRTFTITSCLGRGGFGEVYRATMSGAGGLDADVAVKVLRRDIDPAGQAVQRLRDEGKLLARLHHPTILKVHDLVILEGRVSLVTEFVDGDDLTDCLVGNEPISPRALLEVIGQVASALAAAWHTPLEGASERSLQLVHRDIKPSNIRVGRHGEVKLLDFGIARTDSVEREARTSTNMMVGSPPYMAPERFLDGVIRPGSDVFSLGAALFEGLVHERLHLDWPIPMLASLAIDRDHYEEHVVARLALLPDTLPPALADLLCDMLAYVPEDRPTARQLASRCEALADQMQGKTLARWCRDRVWNEASSERGELEGRTISEGSMQRQMPAPVPVSVVPAPADSGSGRWVLWLVGGGLVVMLLSAAVVIVGGLGGAWSAGWFTESEPPAAEAPAPVPEEPLEDAPAPPEPEAPAAEEPSAAPEIPASPAPEPTAPPVEAPVIAPPAPEAAPVEEAVPTAHVGQSGDAIVVIELHGAAGVFVLPADVPFGQYDIVAKYNGRDGLAAGSVSVGPDGDRTVNCSAKFMRCDVR